MCLLGKLRRPLFAAVIVLAAVAVACSSTAGPVLRATAAVAAAEPQATTTPTATVPPPEPTSTPSAGTSTGQAAAAPGTTSQFEPVADAEGVLARLTDTAWGLLEFLTRQLSPRESATDEERAAADFLMSEFEALGMQTRLQPFTVELLSRDVPALSIKGPEPLRFDGFPMRFAARGRVTGVLEDVGLAFDVDPEKVNGKIALIERGTLTFESKVRRVEEAGAIAAVVYNNEPGAFSGRLMRESSIPSISISQENGEAIKALMAAGDVTATVSIVFETANSRNVIAEMSGNSSGGRVVVLGAHYDTVPDIQGANDNGSGVATLMTVAREVAGKSFPFDLRFVLFGSEEVGLFGSRHFVDGLSQAERESVVAMLNFDVTGTGEFPEVIGSRSLVEAAVAHGAANGIEVHRGVLLEGASSDHAPFRDIGIPVAFFLADDQALSHTPADTIESVRPELLGIASFLGLRVLDTLADRFR